jgi:hypothetical protein
MATAVQIELKVDESGAVSGVRSFDTAIKGTTGSVRQLNTELSAVGTHAAQAGTKSKEGLDKVGHSALNSHQKVHLLTEEMGIHIPRAMQQVISKCPTVMNAINGISGAMIGLAAIQIGGMVFEAAIKGAEKLWSALTELPQAVRDYQAEVEKSRNEAFGNTHSIETTRARIDEVTESIKKANEEYEKFKNGPPEHTWRSAADALPGAGALWESYHRHEKGNELQSATVEKRKTLDKLQSEKDQEQYHQQQEDENRIRAAERASAAQKLPEAAQAKAKRDAAVRDAVEKAAEKRRYENEQDRKYGLHTPQDAGASAEKAAVLEATVKADEDLARSKKKHNGDAAELARIHEQAIESALRGSALYVAQEAHAIQELKDKHIASAQAVADIHAKFHNEEMRRLEEQSRATEKIEQRAALAGMTGMAKTRREGANSIADIEADPNLDPEQRDRRIAAAKLETSQQIQAEAKRMAEEVDALSDRSADHQVQGFKRIAAENTRLLDEWKKKIEAVYGVAPKIGPATPEQATGQQLFHQVTGKINQGSAEERAELTKKNSEETLHLEQEARRRSLVDEKHKTQAIKAELDERLQKYKQELDDEQISQSDYDRRAAAAQQLANAEMVEANKQARDKMAHEFTEFYKGMEDPKKYLKELGDKSAGQASAYLVQKFQQHHGMDIAAPQQNGGLSGMFSSFGLGGFGKMHKTPGVGGDAKAELHSTRDTHAALSTFSVASATIHIGSASFAGGGGLPGAGGSTAAGSRWSGGSALSTPGMISSTSDSSGWSASGGSALTSPGTTGATGGFGGASDSGGNGATPNFNAGSPGSAPAKGPGILGKANSVMGDVSQARKLAKTFAGGSKKGAAGDSGDGPESGASPGAGLMAGGSGKTAAGNDVVDASSLSPAGSGSSSSRSHAGSGGMLEGGGIKSNLGGAVEGGVGLYSASQGQGGVGGAFKGAASGAELGMSVAGPIGAAVGAVAGAVVGFMGSKEQAHVYDLKVVRPGIQGDLDAYHHGETDYLSTYTALESLRNEAFQATNKMGHSGRTYRNEHIVPEFKEAEAKLSAQEKAGRSKYTAQAASYAVGTDYVPATGFNLNHEGERIMRSDQNERITRAVESGASLEKVHASYQAAMQSNDARRGSGGGDRTMNMNVHAIDSKGVAQFLDTYKHHIRAAVNDSYAENSGGGMN